MFRIRTIAAVTLLTLAAAACAGDGADEVSLSISSPDEGASIEGNVVELDLDADGIDIVAADGDTSGDTGHFHVFIDREPLAAGETIPKEPGIIHSTDDPIQITGLSTGEHTIAVVYGDGTHARIGDTEARVTVTVEGPAVTATAVVDGSNVTVKMGADGVDVVADPPSAEHFHVFLDVEPDLDEAIPLENPAIVHTREATVTFEDVSAGEHTIWVVLGDADHVPLDPPVMARLTATVT